MSNIKKGKLGEDLAREYLIKKNYKILEENYITSAGEIDIIAFDKKILVFIEVKSRSNLKYGHPYEAVNLKKQEKIINSSLLYIQKNNFDDIQLRYDIVEVYLSKNKINHMENSFSL